MKTLPCSCPRQRTQHDDVLVIGGGGGPAGASMDERFMWGLPTAWGLGSEKDHFQLNPRDPTGCCMASYDVALEVPEYHNATFYWSSKSVRPT